MSFPIPSLFSDARASVVATKALFLEYGRLGVASKASPTSLIVARAQSQFVLRGNMTKARADDKRFERAAKMRDLRTGTKTNKLIGKYFRIQMMQ